jgi:hypothetical protein
MPDPGSWRMIVAVERHTAAIIQEEAMQTSPISTEMSVQVHFDDLAREAEMYRAARRVLQSARSDRQDQAVSARPLIWIRRLAGMVRGASV